MDRRSFLKRVAAAAVIGAAAPKLLAEPITPVYFAGVDLGAPSEVWPGKMIVLKARSLGITTLPLLYQHRLIFLDTEVKNDVS